MDANNLLIWLVVISTILAAIRGSFFTRKQNRSWLVVTLIIMAVWGAGLAFAPQVAGYLAFAAWLPLFMAPALLARLAFRLVARQRYRAAVWVARLMALFHPTRLWREQPRVLKALALAKEGQTAEAGQLLAELSERDTALGRQAQLQLMRVENRWADIVDWVHNHPRRPLVLFNASILSIYLRALGETGRTVDMLDVYAAFLPEIHKRFGPSLALIQMFLAAMVGRAQTVDKLITGPLAAYDEPIRQFWKATALQKAGDREGARRLLEPLAESSDALIRQAARRRLDDPFSPFDESTLKKENLEVLDAIDSDLADLASLGTLARPALGRATATYVLLLIQAIVFAIEIPNGTTDVANLVELGALIGPAEYLEGEYWRVFTAGFLHFGVLHLALNLFGIWYFGRFLERVLGWVRYVLIYALSGMGALALIMTWTSIAGSKPFILVGASASLMGIVGASAAVLLRRWLRTRSRLVGRQLGFLGVILLLQTAFDLATPQVSFAAHAGGALIGLVFGLVLSGRDRDDSPRVTAEKRDIADE